MVLTYVVRERLADRIKQNDGYACLTNKVTDIYLNICHLLTFICCFDTGKTMTSFVNTIDILEHFDSTLTDSESIFRYLKINFKTTMQIKEFENLSKDKEKKGIKLVKRADRTRLFSSKAAEGVVFQEYSHLIHPLTELQQDSKSNSAAKGLLKKTGNIKFLSIVYILPSCYLI